MRSSCAYRNARLSPDGTRVASGGETAPYDVSPDAQRFLVMSAPTRQAATAAPLRFVVASELVRGIETDCAGAMKAQVSCPRPIQPPAPRGR